MKVMAVILVLASFLFLSAPLLAVETEGQILIRTYGAVGLLYSQTEDGGMRMRCTATAFEHVKGIYTFVTASHCVGTDDTQHERVKVDKTRFFITFDESAEKKFFSAKVIAAGYQHRGDDFAYLSVDSTESWPTVDIGDEAQELVGASIINVASPLGLGKQAYHGYITNLKLDRPVVEGDINWTDVMLVQLPVGPGSSGSSIVSVKQGKIVGFVVGSIAEQSFTAMPVSRFKAFRVAIEAKKYKWYVPEE